MPRCQNCTIEAGGRYKILKFTLGLSAEKDGAYVVQDRIEQKLYSVDGLKMCKFCLETLAERGYLIRLLPWTQVPTFEIIFRDKSRVQCYYQSLLTTLREEKCKRRL
jgi:hypothetical protein